MSIYKAYTMHAKNVRTENSTVEPTQKHRNIHRAPTSAKIFVFKILLFNWVK